MFRVQGVGFTSTTTRRVSQQLLASGLFPLITHPDDNCRPVLPTAAASTANRRLILPTDALSCQPTPYLACRRPILGVQGYHDDVAARFPRALGIRVVPRGSGFRVQGSGFRVQGSEFRVQGPGFGVQGFVGSAGRFHVSAYSGFRVPEVWFTVYGLRLRAFGFGFRL